MTRAVTLTGYAVIVGAMVAAQAAALLGAKLPTIGGVLRFLTGRRAGRWVLLAAWIWVGWHLFVRADHG